MAAAAGASGKAAAALATRLHAAAAGGTRLQLLRTLCVSAASCSAVGGRPDPLDLTRETTPMLHQPDSRRESETGAWELRVPGVVGHVEPNVPKPGSVLPPNPSPSLLEPVPIAKVTHDGDVTARSIPEAPGSNIPRS